MRRIPQGLLEEKTALSPPLSNVRFYSYRFKKNSNQTEKKAGKIFF
jgi:hypothetical protein